MAGMGITTKSPTVATRLREEDYEALRRLALQNDRSMSAELRRVIRLYLESNGKDGVAA